MRFFKNKAADTHAPAKRPAVAATLVLTLEHAACVAGGINPQPLPPFHSPD